MSKAGQERYWARWRKVVKAAKKAAKVAGKPIKAGRVKAKARPRPLPLVVSTLNPLATVPGLIRALPDSVRTGKGAVGAGTGKSLGDRARELKEKFRPKGQ